MCAGTVQHFGAAVCAGSVPALLCLLELFQHFVYAGTVQHFVCAGSVPTFCVWRKCSSILCVQLMFQYLCVQELFQHFVCAGTILALRAAVCVHMQELFWYLSGSVCRKYCGNRSNMLLHLASGSV